MCALRSPGAAQGAARPTIATMNEKELREYVRYLHNRQKPLVQELEVRACACDARHGEAQGMRLMTGQCG